MKKIIFTGSNVGFKKVSFNRLLRSELGLSLSDAKNAVDSILDEKEVVIEVESQQLAEKILYEASELNAIVKLE